MVSSHHMVEPYYLWFCFVASMPSHLSHLISSTVPYYTWCMHVYVCMCHRRLPSYVKRWKDRFPTDLLAGVTVAALCIPQAMSYAQIAGVHPVSGHVASDCLYVCFLERQFAWLTD